ncbi:hypothetical protein [uncultured Nostoc sp.]
MYNPIYGVTLPLATASKSDAYGGKLRKVLSFVIGHLSFVLCPLSVVRYH